MYVQAILGALGAGHGGGRARVFVIVAGALILAVHVAVLMLIASAGAGWAIDAGSAVGRTVGPFFASALLIAMLAPMRVLLRRADALACRVLS